MTTFDLACGVQAPVLIACSICWRIPPSGQAVTTPYNIERAGEDCYRISLALAGFSRDEVTVLAEQNVLTVEGRKTEKGMHQYLYQGISSRPFRRQFNLAEYVQVKGASFEDGVLKIDLVREVPEAMRPRQIPINAVNDNKRLEHTQTA